MIFSVWNHANRNYDYFKAPGNSANYGARGTKYRPLNQPPQGPFESQLVGYGAAGMGGARVQGPPGRRIAIGFTPEALALPLPLGAQRVGSGNEARGVIATQRSNVNARAQGEGRYADVSGLGGLGEDGKTPDAEPPPPPAIATARGVPFTQVVGAAVIASIVGVVVQKLLR